MSGAVLAPADQDLTQLSRISGGIRLAALPFQADLRLQLDGDDAAWAQGLDARFQEGKQKVISDYGKDLPSMSLLAETLVSDVTENDITFTLSIDEAAIKTFAALPGEFLKILLGGLGANFSQSGENEPLEERLLEASEVIPYLAKIDSKALLDFNPEDNVFISADAISGPFGIMLRATRISEQPAEDNSERLEIVLEAHSSTLPNVPEDSFHNLSSRPTAAIIVNKIKSITGKNLLLAEDCGKDRNQEPTPLQFQPHNSHRNGVWVRETRTRGEKALRLPAGTIPADITSIECEVMLLLAAATRRIEITAPCAGQVVEDPGVRLLFEETRPDSLKYTLSGATDRILAVRALNGSGRHLSSAGTSGGEALFGSSKHVERRFQGRVAKAEVFIVTKEEELRYPYQITRALPAFTIWIEDEAPTIPITSAANFKKSARLPEKACDNAEAEVEASPFRLCLVQFQRFFGPHYQVGFTILGPESAALDLSASGTELRLDKLKLKDGGEIEVGEGAFLDLRWDSFSQALSGQSYLSLELSSEVAANNVAAIEGALILRFPQSLTTLGLDDTTPGAKIAGSDMTMRLMGYELGNTLLEFTGERAHLVGFQAFDEAGAAIPIRTNQLADDGSSEAPWEVNITTSGPPNRIEALLSLDQEVIEIPFVINR